MNRALWRTQRTEALNGIDKKTPSAGNGFLGRVLRDAAKKQACHG